MIRTIIFDLGGVIATIDNEEPKRRFLQLGVKNIEEQLDPYCQTGIFGDLEEGVLSEADYREALGKICGRTLTFEEVKHCWLGYMKEVPANKLQAILQLRKEGYRVVLLSNTNPYVMDWADSTDFSGDGHPLGYYFDAMYRSYEVKYMKPDENFFRYVLAKEELLPDEALFVDDGPHNVASASQLGIRTFCPENGSDWTQKIYDYLEERP